MTTPHKNPPMSASHAVRLALLEVPDPERHDVKELVQRARAVQFQHGCKQTVSTGSVTSHLLALRRMFCRPITKDKLKEYMAVLEIEDQLERRKATDTLVKKYGGTSEAEYREELARKSAAKAPSPAAAGECDTSNWPMTCSHAIVLAALQVGDPATANRKRIIHVAKLILERHGITETTTSAGAGAVFSRLFALLGRDMTAGALQEYYDVMIKYPKGRHRNQALEELSGKYHGDYDRYLNGLHGRRRDKDTPPPSPRWQPPPTNAMTCLVDTGDLEEAAEFCKKVGGADKAIKLCELVGRVLTTACTFV